MAGIALTGCDDTPPSPLQLYRSEEGRRKVLELYERKMSALDFQHRSRFVPTDYGLTHVLEAGDEALPPLLALHGVNFGAPFMADIARPLLANFRLVVPDIVGQPGRSAQSQPAREGRNYGRWAVQVLDALGIDALPVMGISFGGAVCLDLAAIAPRRIAKAVLIVPGGFATSPLSAVGLLAKLFIPWHAYRFFPDTRILKRILHPLAWEMDPFSYEYFDAVLQHVRWLIPPPGPFSQEDLTALAAPTAVYAARDDIFFPGDALVEEARRVLPNLADAFVYPSSHYPTPEMYSAVLTRTAAFLADHPKNQPP